MDKQNLALVFPGQGSQKVGMLAELAEAHPIITATFAEASDALDYDMWKLVQQGSRSNLISPRPLSRYCSPPLWQCGGCGVSRKAPGRR